MVDRYRGVFPVLVVKSLMENPSIKLLKALRMSD